VDIGVDERRIVCAVAVQEAADPAVEQNRRNDVRRPPQSIRERVGRLAAARHTNELAAAPAHDLTLGERILKGDRLGSQLGQQGLVAGMERLRDHLTILDARQQDPIESDKLRGERRRLSPDLTGRAERAQLDQHGGKVERPLGAAVAAPRDQRGRIQGGRPSPSAWPRRRISSR
jgi:hypothetical protein